jgi:EAL domain-containing protein (putative c-di-GMP-specific phosphodiesterase class I)/tetratricopeptide (TPR) repeat protein
MPNTNSPWPAPAAEAGRSSVFANLARARLVDDPEEAAKLALKSIEAARAEGDKHATAVGMLILGHACEAGVHSAEDVLRPVRYAIDQLILLGDTRNLGDARLLQAKLLQSQCAYEEAEFEARSARELAISCEDHHLIALCDLRLGTVLIESNGPDQASYRQRLTTASATFLEMGDLPNAARALLNIGISALDTDPRETVRVSAQALALIDGTESPLIAELRTTRADAAARLGWVAVAEGELADIEAIHQARPLPTCDVIGFTTVWANVHRAAGRIPEAQMEYRRATHLAEEVGDHKSVVESSQGLLDLCELQGDVSGALEASRSLHSAYVRLKEQQAARRRQMFDLAGRLEAERRDERNRSAHFEMQRTVDVAREDLAAAEQQLELERSRRSLVELRASHDPAVEPVTGLPSLGAIATAVTSMLDDGGRVAIVIMTVDDDRVAAVLPDVRERLMQEMSARAHAFLKGINGAFAGALGPEDIVGVIPVPQGSNLEAVLGAMHLQMSRPVDLVDRDISAAVQFGVAVAPDHGIRANALLSRARLAAQAARRERPYSKSIAVFQNQVEERQELRMFVHEKLGSAIANEHIEVYFQPLVDAKSGSLIGAEALVRWTDPERGDISPGIFFPFAEETGHIVQLGGHILTRACCEAAAWPALAGGLLGMVSVNVSAAQIAGGTVLAQVDAALLMSGLSPERLALELSESALTRTAEVLPVLQALRSRGITIEIDDFGTNTSSFGNLTRLPVDCVKMDKSFVDRITEIAGDDAAIAQAIITMAHSLRLTVVAKGVETDVQAAVLRGQGCDVLQGWLFAKAMSPSEFTGWVAAYSVGTASTRS